MTSPDSTNGPTRVAIVTGGSGGIGQAICRRLAADGMAVTINYAGRPHEAELAVKAISESGGRAIAIRADVADEDQVSQLFDATEESFGCTESTFAAPSLSAGKRPVDFAREDPSSTSHPQW
jgi:NAD(P)-dependent dehydrogenase (short-subunit alcohol dehydrogenase family)